MTTYKWTKAETLPDGHRIFATLTDDGLQYAIADDSGDLPEQTDDGILWLDETRPLLVDRDDRTQYCSIPLIDEDGKQTLTPTDVSTLLHLANQMRWMITDEHVKATYEVH